MLFLNPLSLAALSAMTLDELNGLLLGGTYSNAVAPTAFSTGISADRPPLLF